MTALPYQPANGSGEKVDVLQVLDAVPCMPNGDGEIRLLEARAAVAELIEAVIENREAEQAFANNGEPDNYRRWDASERRLLMALANVGAQP